jgi:hypothetical protein
MKRVKNMNKRVTEKEQQDREHRLYKSGLLGFAYVGEEPASFRTAATNVMSLSLWLLRIFAMAAKRRSQSQVPAKTPNEPSAPDT